MLQAYHDQMMIKCISSGGTLTDTSTTRIVAPRRYNPEVSIIVPARNEELNLASMPAVVNHPQTGVQTDVTFEIIVVDDASTTSPARLPRVLLECELFLPDLPRYGWTGKEQCVIAGVQSARRMVAVYRRGHHPSARVARSRIGRSEKRAGRLAVVFARTNRRQLSERAVMPVVFAELAAQYPPHKVRAQKSGIVAANGQYILVRR